MGSPPATPGIAQFLTAARCGETCAGDFGCRLHDEPDSDFELVPKYKRSPGAFLRRRHIGVQVSALAQNSLNFQALAERVYRL